MIPWILFSLSLAINLFLAWYIREMLLTFWFFRDNFESYSNKIEEYSDHIKEVLNKELFFDDPVIKSLLNHAEEIMEESNTFKNGFSIDD